ncbi:MAG: hypothetical protein ACOYNC_11550 [Bacteroidales bacterium]
MTNSAVKRQNSLHPLLFLLFGMILFMGSGCRKSESSELYHRFSDHSWARFNVLSFELPVEKVNACNIYLFARFSPDFPYETLDFNMTMNTPSGEERINEYQMPVKSASGGFCIECRKDSCMGIILLKKELNMAKPGILRIEIENLTPRLNTEGILGIGVRMVPSGK